MNGKTAAFVFAGICLIVVILLLLQAISPPTSGIIFAVGLVVFGVLSRGFRK